MFENRKQYLWFANISSALNIVRNVSQENEYALLSLYTYHKYDIYTGSQKELLTRGADSNINQYYAKTAKRYSKKVLIFSTPSFCPDESCTPARHADY